MKIIKAPLKTLIIFLLILTATRMASSSPPPDIRVLVRDSIPNVTIRSNSSPLRIDNPSTRDETTLDFTITVEAGESGLTAAGRDLGARMTISNRDREFRVGDNSFRGVLDIAWTEPGKLMLINQLPLEDYLVGLINSEISSRWPPEAVKAQTLAARTYALSRSEGARRAVPPKLYDVSGTVLDQVYHGSGGEDDPSYHAVASTRGEVLRLNGSIFPTYYHSCCGGRTEYAHNVWPGETTPATAEDPFCHRSPKFKWSYKISVVTFKEVLQRDDIQIGDIQGVSTTELPDSPRVEYLLITDDEGIKMVRATTLRRMFGYQNIKSTWFEVTLNPSEITFEGRGYGHGVGLCQWGAKAMAEAGKSYREILEFYYPGVEIAKAY